MEGQAGAGGASSGAAAAAAVGHAVGGQDGGTALLGERVVLSGLSSRPELNGRRGVVRSFEGGRYAVALEGGGESVRVRPGNLSLAAAEPVSGGGVEVSDEVIGSQQLSEARRRQCWPSARPCSPTCAGAI